MNLKVSFSDAGCTIIYKTTKCKKKIQDFGYVTVYGITAYFDNYTSKNKISEYYEIDDISDNEDTVKDLFELITANGVLPIHMSDVILDYIG